MASHCIDGKFLNQEHICQLCETAYKILPGFEFSKNCGWSNGSNTQSPYKQCRNGTFNDGSHVKCQKCGSCPTPEFISCSSTSDTICCQQGEQVSNGACVPQPPQTTAIITVGYTTVSRTSINPSAGSSITSPTTTTSTSQRPSQKTHNAIDLTGIYIFLGVLSALTLVCLFLVIKRRRIRHLNEEFHKCNGAVRESLSKKEQSISYNMIRESDNSDPVTGSACLLAPDVQSAPLKSVLNNLDVLEELVLVLDPDISGAKNTRHLAAHCSFSFAWINYAYSMKDHKSPLVAVLEGVVTKNPDWTVGHLAELLTTIGRNDALEILSKLPAVVER